MSDIEELWCKHAGEVCGFLQKRCGDRELSEDLTAETFLQAGRAVEREQTVTVGWLMTVARRRLVDHWRRASRHTATVDRIARERSILSDSQLAAFGVPFEDSDLAHLLGGLCPTQRDALVLRYVLDHTVDAVASELDLSYRAAESVLARGRRNLRDQYAATLTAIG